MSDEVSEFDQVEADEGSIVKSQLTTLVSDFKSLAAAELEYIKVRAAYSGKIAKWTGIYVVLALVALSAVLIILALGSLLMLAEYVGMLAATLIMAVAFGVIAFLCALLARNSASKLVFKAVEGGDDA
jgi:hypothetical protein